MRKIILIAIILVMGILLLNVQVSTRQGINYRVRELKMPLYLKILDFYDRNFNYRQLVKGIINGSKNDEERTMKIFAWTCENIRKPLPGMPIIDDHVWYIIVRGYGEEDQASDVFTTLCNYAGMKAFYSLVSPPDRKSVIPLSFVKISGRWVIFDPYHGVYFKDRNGNLADVTELKNNLWVIQARAQKPDLDYSLYFHCLPEKIEDVLARASIQSPMNRLFFEVKRRFRGRTLR